MRIHINIGSNIGDRMAHIGRAVALLARNIPDSRIYLSDYIESEPWGFYSSNRFLNRGLLLITRHNIAPHDILYTTQRIERIIGYGAPHRHTDGSYRDRIIDIDIIDIDNLTINTPQLTLPHPHAASRPFVLHPMQQLNHQHPC